MIIALSVFSLIDRMPKELTRKNDFVVWLYMSESQIKIYSDFLGLERVKEVCISDIWWLKELSVKFSSKIITSKKISHHLVN